ncbi:MAG: glycerophosphodiester phosphodiesterase family protein [Rugosibacter sp.]
MLAYPRIIAHRGGGALAPENTLAGMHIAQRMGCRGVEFDVALTADGVPILMHDETLERTTSGTGFVAKTTAAEIAKLDAGGKHHYAFAAEPARAEGSTLGVPTFQAALQTCTELGLWMNIEIKPTPSTEVETGRVVASIAAAHLASHPDAAIVCSSFSSAALQQIMHIAPTIPRALLIESIPAHWQSALDLCGAAALHTNAKNLDFSQLTAVCNSKISVACYTVNHRATADKLFAAGVRAIFTDRLDLWQPGEM